MRLSITSLLFLLGANLLNAQVIKFQSVGFGGTTSAPASDGSTIKHSMAIGQAAVVPGAKSGFFFGNIDYRPATQASGISFSSVSATQLTLNFATGNGSRRIVLAKAGGLVDASTADGISYTSNAAFGSGTQIGSGNFVVFDGGVANPASVIITGLALNSTIYYFKVLEYNGKYGGNVSNIVYQPGEGLNNPLASPPIIASSISGFSNTTNNQLTLSWSNGNGERRIILAKAGSAVDASPENGNNYNANPAFGIGNQVGTGNFAVYDGDGTGTATTVTGLAANTTYHFLIVEYNGTGSTSSYAVSTTADKLTLTDATVAISAVAIAQTSFQASWSAVTGSTDYYIDVSEDNFVTTVTGFNNTIITGTSTVVSGLNPGESYQYRVRASNTSGQSANSNTITTLTVPPTPTANTSTLVTTDSFTANWSASISATQYELDVATDNLFSSLVANYNAFVVASTSALVSDLSPNTTYYYRVRAINASGESLESNTISQLTFPQAPVALVAPAVNQTSFTATWNAIIGITDFYLDVSADDFTTLESNYSNQLVSGNSVNVTGLIPGTTYKYRVRSSNATGPSDNSNSVAVLLIPATTIGLVATSVTTSSFSANWQPVLSATEYFIDVSGDNFATTLASYTDASAGTATTVSVTGLTAGTTYQYRVRSKNGTGTSPSSSPISQITVPSKPLNITISAVTKNGFVVNWGAVVGADGYYLDVADVTTLAFVPGYQNKSVPSNFQSITGLTSSTAYRVAVRAFNAGGTSIVSDDVFEATLDDLGGKIEAPEVTIVDNQNTISSVKASVTKGFVPNSVILYHKKITAPGSFVEESPQEFGSGTLEVTVDSSWLDELGMEYYFKVTDKINRSNESGRAYVYSPPSQKTIPNLKAGGELKDYVMFSVPYKLDDNAMESIFDPVLAGYDKTLWRLVRYQGGRNVDYTEGLNKIELGKGYWFNAKEKVDIDMGEGDVVQANQSAPYDLELEQGWTQIGDPFPFAFDWSDVLAVPANSTSASKIDPYILSWDASIVNFKTVDVLRPWEGGFVYSTEAVTLQLPVTLKNTSTGRKGQHGIANGRLDENEWFVPITLLQGETESHYAGFGMHPDADQSKDKYDMAALPRFVKYLEMFTYHKDHFYPWFTRDVVPTALNFTWDFTIESNFEEDVIEVRWDNDALGNNSAVLMLYDVTRQMLVDMKNNSYYRFDAHKKREFKIFYSIDEQSFRPNINGMGQPFPNPFANHVTIPFLVSEDNTLVSIQVFDLTGRKVHELGNEWYHAGYHEAEWNGEDRDGNLMPVGLYVYRLAFNGLGSGMAGRILKK